jgi:RHS repeat-associated protein
MGHSFRRSVIDTRPTLGRRISAFLLGLLVASTSLGAIPSATTPERPTESIPRPIVQMTVPAPATISYVFDNFTRTYSDQYQTWGYATSGAQWGAFACDSGYTARVDGQSGVMTGAAGATCTLADGANELTNPPNAALRYWDAPSWALTSKFKVSALDGSDLGILIATQLNQYEVGGAGVEMHFAATGGTVRAGSSTQPFSWVGNTWYSMKWAVIWGDQTRIKVWPSAGSEPSDWLASSTVGNRAQPPYDSPSLMTTWRSNLSAVSVYQDDYAFGPAPILPKLPPPPGTDRNGQDPNSSNGGDPVSTLTGSFGYHHTDVSIPGRGPAIALTRSYNSNDTRTTTLGPGWTHSYNIRLNDPGDGSSDVILVGPEGRSDRYVLNGSTYTPPPGVHRILVKNADSSYTATDKSQTVWQFDASGLLTQIADRYGNASNLSYDVGNRVSAVSDSAGRGSLAFAYTNGLLTSVTDWASPARSVSYQYDGSGRLWKVTDREGKTTAFGYDGTSSRLTSITDARNNTALTLTYDASGRVATQKDARGLTTGDVTTFDYVVNGDGTRVTTVTAPTTSFEPSFHPTTIHTYDTNGWLTSRVTHPSSTEALTETHGYDATGNRTSVIDPRGNTTNYCYDVDYAGSSISGGRANLTREIDPAPTTGANRPVMLIAYDAKNNVTQRVAPKGVPSGAMVTCSTNLSAINTSYATDFAYDASALKLLSTTTRFTDPDTGAKTATTKYEYGDASNPGLVTRVIPPRGNTTGTPDYTYATTFTYFTSGSKAGLLATSADALGDTTAYDYDSVGRLISRVDPLGNQLIGGYGPYHTTSFTYDKEDRLRTQTAPAPLDGGAGLMTETRYDEVGNPTVRIDPAGQVMTYAYDERDGLLQVKEAPVAWTDPVSPPAGVITTEYAYDAAGNLARMTRAKGDASNERVTDYAFDGRGLVRTETQYPAWPTTTPTLVTATTYDANGNLSMLVDPLTATTTSGYDALNRRTSITYSDGVTPNVAYGYDANDNRTSMTDGTGASSYLYDEANRLTSATTPGPKTIGYRYDLDGDRTKVIYPDLTAVSYTFNKGGQLASLQDWAGRSVGYTYWPDGLVKTATNPDATAASYAYDNTRRLVDIAHLGTAGQYLDRSFYTVNTAGNATSVNHGLLPAQVSRPDGFIGSNGIWTGTYASINEVIPNDSTILASPTGPTSANYYEVSLSDVSPPMDLTNINIHYRISKSGNNSGQTTGLLVELRQGSTVVYSASYTSLPGSSGSGWLDDTIKVSQQQAPTITNFNDLRLRFTPSTSGGGQARKAQISWAEVGVPSPAAPTAATAYTYDKLNRLTGSSGQNGSFAYGYDPVGNRTSMTAAGTTTYTYDRADRMTAAGAAAVTVNANGNTTVRGSDTFAFDQSNRLKTATVSGSTETYQYDADGLRFSRQVGAGTPIRYVSDSNRSLPVTIDDGTRKYVYGNGLGYAVSGSTVEVYHADRLGTIRAITTGGTVVATYRTDDWGNLLGQTGSSGQPLGFTGEPRDGTGLTYLRARYYDPSLGRFMTRDTWHGLRAIPGSLNDYAYLMDNPVGGVDHDGHCGPPCAIAGFFIGGLGGFGGYLLSNAATGTGFDVGQALLATGAGATTGAVCGVTFGLTCAAVGGATSVAQYALSPGEHTVTGAIKSVVLGGALGWLARGGIFNERALLTTTSSAAKWANPVDLLLMNYQTNLDNVIGQAVSSLFKSLGGSAIQNVGTPLP